MIRKITKELRQHILTAREAAQPQSETWFQDGYDVCVIGSGPGGAVTAATLAATGKKVVLIERGPFFPVEESNFRVLDNSGRKGHLEVTSGLRTLLYQGNGLGGGSLVYGAVAMKPPDYVFDEWKERSGVKTIDRQALEAHYQAVGEVLSVTEQTREIENESNAIVRQMATALGKPDGLELVERYTAGCAGVGLCNLGCGFDLKGTMSNSFIPLGLATGKLNVLTECEAHGFEGVRRDSVFHATGLHVTCRDFANGHTLRRATIKAKHYVVAAGAFFSSALLLGNQDLPGRDKIGARVYLQPHAQIFALYDRAVTKRGELKDGHYIPYQGVPAIYNFTGFLQEHRFFWLASILFPANLATFIAHLPPSEHFELMRRYHQTMSITLTLRDEPDKSRIVRRNGKAQLDFRESRADIENLRQCFLLAARSMLATGARRVFLPLLRPPRIEQERDLAQIQKLKFGYEDLVLYSDHTSGGNSYGRDAQHGVTDEGGQFFGTRNLYAADSSLFPSAPGINPSWTIMALARRNALRLTAQT